MHLRRCSDEEFGWGALPNGAIEALLYREGMAPYAINRDTLAHDIRSISVIVGFALILASCGWQQLSESAAGASTGAGETAAVEVVGTAPQTLPTTTVPATTTVPTSTTTTTAPAATTVPATTTVPTSTTTTSPIPTLASDAVSLPGMASVWTGWVGSDFDRAPVSIQLAEQRGNVRGEITYTNTGETRMLAGSRLASGFFVHEFDASGNALSTMSVGAIDRGVMTDITWERGRVEVELSDSVDASRMFVPVVSPGRFDYAFSPFGGDRCCGPTGTLSIHDVTASSVTVSIDTVTSAPARNIATIGPLALPLDGNIARFEERNDWLDCAFEVIVFSDFIFVEHVDERFDCGFGVNASVEGIYAAVSS